MQNTLNLDNVTLVAIDGVGKDSRHLKALKYSCKNIKFAKVKFISPTNWENHSFYEFIKIKNFSYSDYNKFCVTELYKHIETDYLIIIQDDGFILNDTKWNDIFYDYDYIGAPWNKNHLWGNTQRWPFIHQKLIESKNAFNVGNGGFSFRSKKLLEACSYLYRDEYFEIPEDALICIGFRQQLENIGIKFAPYNIAKLFSCETIFGENETLSSDNTFGFHCKDTHKDKIRLLDQINISGE